MKTGLFSLVCALLTALAAGQSLPGTAPLAPNPDFSAAMVAGVDAFFFEKNRRR